MLCLGFVWSCSRPFLSIASATIRCPTIRCPESSCGQAKDPSNREAVGLSLVFIVAFLSLLVLGRWLLQLIRAGRAELPPWFLPDGSVRARRESLNAGVGGAKEGLLAA